MSGDLAQEAALTAMLAEGPVTRLDLGAGRITLAVVSGTEPHQVTVLPAGSFDGVLGHLRHEPALAHELEAAIVEVEDGLMPALRSLHTHRRLLTAAPGMDQIARAAGAVDPTFVDLDIETVERLFLQLARLAQGTPAAHLGIPADRGFAAHLLILREVLHHGGFESVRVFRPGAPPPHTA